MKSIQLVLLTIVSAMVLSCQKDQESPQIIVNTPANHSDHSKGSEVAISATFSDDVELASYHVHIGNEAGAHVSDFHFEDVGSLTGDTYNYESSITVPDTVGTMYWLHFEVIDAEGKMTAESVMLHFN